MGGGGMAVAKIDSCIIESFIVMLKYKISSQ